MDLKADKPKHKVTLSSLLSTLEEQYSRDDALFHSASVEHLEGYDDVLSYLANKGKTHRHYRHYATRSRAQSIL